MCFLLYFLAALVEFSVIRGPPIQWAWCGVGPVEWAPPGLWGRGPGIHSPWLLPGACSAFKLTMLFLVNQCLNLGGSAPTQWLSRHSEKRTPIHVYVTLLSASSSWLLRETRRLGEGGFHVRNTFRVLRNFKPTSVVKHCKQKCLHS